LIILLILVLDFKNKSFQETSKQFIVICVG
jgi:hypothetical protein